MSQTKTPSTLAPWKASSACLSSWQLTRLACGDAQPTPAQRQHLEACRGCSRDLATETEQVEAGRAESVPTYVLEGAGQPSRQSWVWGGLASCAAMAVCWVLLVAPAADDALPEYAVKGAISVMITAQREGIFIADNEPIEKAPALQAGDRLRLRLVGVNQAFIRVRGFDGTTVSTFYEGPPTPDGWLPTGFRMDARPTTRLEIMACDLGPPTLTGCTQQTFAF